MPMIDVTFPADLLPAAARRPLAEALASALLRAEGAPATSPYLDNTCVYLHERPRPRCPLRSRLNATRLVAEAVGDAAAAPRTWVLLREAAEGGWGVGGHALGQVEFAALRAARAGAAS